MGRGCTERRLLNLLEFKELQCHNPCPVEIISILLKCIPFLGCVGAGFYLLLTVIFPSWREPGWSHYRIYSTDRPQIKTSWIDPGSAKPTWLADMGLVKPAKPVKEGDMNVSMATWVYSIIGLVFLAVGGAGLVWIVMSSR